MLRTALTVLQVFCAFGIIGLVLLQRGKGADAGAGFGAGASGTVFGARGASTALSRATAILAAVFMINSLALAYMGTRSAQRPSSTLLDQASVPAPSAPAPAMAPQPVPPAGQSGAPAPASPGGSGGGAQKP